MRTKEGLVYFRDPRYRLRAKSSLPRHYDLVDSSTPSRATQIPEDVDAKITADGRVHLFRQHSLTIVDLETGDVSFYEMPSSAEAVFGWCEAAFPRRVTSEEIGDALEQINRWRREAAVVAAAPRGLARVLVGKKESRAVCAEPNARESSS
jgi:hypothetical protein